MIVGTVLMYGLVVVNKGAEIETADKFICKVEESGIIKDPLNTA